MKQPDTGTTISTHAASAARADDPEALAKHAIKLLEQRIRNDFGLRVAMGAEVEFAVLPNQANLTDARFSLPDKLGSDFLYTASAARSQKQRDRWFPESRRVNRTYRESPTMCSWQQMEVVLTHEPSRADGEPLKTDCITLGHTIAALRNHIKHMPRGLKNAPTQEQQIDRFYWQQLRAHHIHEVRFNASIPSSNIHNGLHLNMSLIGADNCEPILQQPRMATQLQNNLGYMMEENLYLLGSSYPAIERWRDHYGRRVTTFSQQIKKKVDYLENRLPAADSNPYYAIMLQLAGTYNALAESSEDASQCDPQTHHMDMLSPSLLMKEFNNGILLKQTLNTMEPGLGNRFYAAIAKTPPGHEKSALKMQR